MCEFSSLDMISECNAEMHSAYIDSMALYSCIKNSVAYIWLGKYSDDHIQWYSIGFF